MNFTLQRWLAAQDLRRLPALKGDLTIAAHVRRTSLCFSGAQVASL